jgi:tetratricopeptide (TPR) repeat protein
MAKHAVHVAACFAIFASLLLSACATRGPRFSESRTELRDTPFHPQARHQCGPAALATVLGSSGVSVSADELVPRVYLPARRGSLQLEMIAAPRELGRLPLVLPRHLEAIIAELEGGRPVLVLHNYGWRWWPRWHYAVVIGYDPERDEFILRSGREARKTMRTRHFLVYWRQAARWAMVVLRPGETAANDDARLYLEAAAEFERRASAADSFAVFDAAVSRWPLEAVSWIGRGTAHYRLGNALAAAHDYAEALKRDSSQAGARNNLAHVLIELGCPGRARRELARIDVQAISPALREAVAETTRDLNERADEDPETCSAIP